MHDQFAAEFASYYNARRAAWIAEDHRRASWAPANPGRLFALAREVSHPYRRVLDQSELLDAVYLVLEGGGKSKRSVGLFQDFDPSRYQGRLPLPDHFTNLFACRLKARLKEISRPDTDAGRLVEPEERHLFRPRPGIGLFEQERGARGGSGRLAETVVSGRVSPLAESIMEAMQHLDTPERLVILLWYWEDLSARKIGEQMGIDHKTVQRRHDAAIRKLKEVLSQDLAA